MTAYCVADDVVVGNHAKRDKNLQEQAVDPGKGYTFQSGDTIIISKDVKQYLTGEEPSEWVYYVRHIVGQVGGKRFPQGILVQGINSWVGPDGLFLVGAANNTAAAQKQKAEDLKKVQQQANDFQKLDPNKQKEIAQAAKDNNADLLDNNNSGNVNPAVTEKPADSTDSEITETPGTDEIVIEEEEKPITAETINREIDRFSIGLRGGVASMLHNTIDGANGKWKLGFDVLLDLQYAHYWQKGDQPSYGILTGLSAGYVRSGVTSEASYTIPSNGQLSYDINVKAKEYDGAVLLEVPLMFSMITNKGFFFNVGPRFQLPVFNHYKTTVDNATEKNIVALFEKEGVKVDDQIVTGRADSEKGTNQTISKFNLLLGAELGYEWRLKNNNSFGLGVYANYGLFSLYKNDAAGQILDITAPNGTSFGQVDINSITKTYTQGDGFKFGAKNGLDFFDCGIKLNYSFNFVKQ